MKEQKTINSSIFLIIFLMGASVQSCYYNKAELLYPGTNQPVDCITVPAKFGADVFPLITSKCAIPSCHNATASGGLILKNYLQISGAKSNINTRAVIEKSMPPAGPLLPAEINIIKCWIESGAPNN